MEYLLLSLCERRKLLQLVAWQCPSNLLNCPAPSSFLIPVNYRSGYGATYLLLVLQPLLSCPALQKCHFSLFLWNCSHCPVLFFSWKSSFSKIPWLGDWYISVLPLKLSLFITQVLAAVFLESSATATLNNLQGQKNVASLDLLAKEDWW